MPVIEILASEYLEYAYTESLPSPPSIRIENEFPNRVSRKQTMSSPLPELMLPPLPYRKPMRFACSLPVMSSFPCAITPSMELKLATASPDCFVTTPRFRSKTRSQLSIQIISSPSFPSTKSLLP